MCIPPSLDDDDEKKKKNTDDARSVFVFSLKSFCVAKFVVVIARIHARVSTFFTLLKLFTDSLRE